MKEESKSYQDKKIAIRNELRDKYKFYANIVRGNRLDTPHIHKQYCQSNSHRQCGTRWGHADIVREIIARLWWWFTGNKPYDVNIARKPKLQSITEQIFNQRKENELEDEEYFWLMNIKDKCKVFLNAEKDRVYLHNLHILF